MTLDDHDVRLEVMRRLVLSAETRERLRTMPGERLALLLREHVLAEMPMDSAFADLICACADRLAGEEGEPGDEVLEAAPTVPADVPETARVDEDGCCLVCGRDVYGCGACQRIPLPPKVEAAERDTERALHGWLAVHSAQNAGAFVRAVRALLAALAAFRKGGADAV